MQDLCEMPQQPGASACLHEPSACLLSGYPVSLAIFTLARSHRARAASKLAEIGLFPGQEIMLMTIAAKDGESQKFLCDSIGLDHSTVAKSLTRLEAQGLIQRHKCSDDGRVTKVYMTDKGRQMTADVARVWAELEKITVAELTDVEREQLIAIAGKITPKMDVQNREQHQRQVAAE